MAKEKAPRRKDCMPKLIYPDTLATGQDDFMNWERISKECACIHKSTCNKICELLMMNKYAESLDLVRKTRKQISLTITK